MKRIIVYGISKEIEKYNPKFLEKIECFITEDKNEKENFFQGKPIRKYAWLLEQNNVFIIISYIFNKYKYIKKLSSDGFVSGRDFAWAPVWYGNEELPSCYPMRTWEDNEGKYDFSGVEGPWDEQYQELLTMMPTSYKSVLDCGAGNMSLKTLLNDGTIYYPVDKEKRYPNTIVCDFNSREFPDIWADVIFLRGILEYIICPKVFIKNICTHTKTVLLTYCSLHLYPDISARMLNGWKNHYVTGELVRMFYENGFALNNEVYEKEGGVYLRFDSIK